MRRDGVAALLLALIKQYRIPLGQHIGAIPAFDAEGAGQRIGDGHMLPAELSNIGRAVPDGVLSDRRISCTASSKSFNVFFFDCYG